MPSDGAGSQRIVLVGEQRTARDVHPPREAAVKQRPMSDSGWTASRLAIACVLGGAAAVGGGVMFVSRFSVLGGNDSPLLAMGFGLFVIGMVVFCASLIALIGTGISALAERHGWPSAAAAALAPLALVWSLWALGAVAYAPPAVLSLMLIGGLVVALK